MARRQPDHKWNAGIGHDGRADRRGLFIDMNTQIRHDILTSLAQPGNFPVIDVQGIAGPLNF